MLASATVSSIHALCAEPGIHPLAAEMRDIILGKAVDGLPAMEDDFAKFTLADIKTHFPAARAEANKQTVRQLDDERGFESRAALLIRATGLMLGKMPSEPAMHSTLRSNGLSNAEIADIWPDLLETSTNAFKRARALPLSQEAS